MNRDFQIIDQLPSIEAVRRASQGLAMLDAILMPDWEHRYFSFNADWNTSAAEMMASMRDGSGSEYFVLFSEAGAVGKVLDADSAVAPRQALDAVPPQFASFKGEPAFRLDDATYFFWRVHEADAWSVAPNSATYAHLGFIAGGASNYHTWAESYYERSIDKSVLTSVFDSLTITPDQLSVLNPELTLVDLSTDLREILRNL